MTHRHPPRVARAAVALLLALVAGLVGAAAPTAPVAAQEAPLSPAAAAGRWLAEEHRWHTDAVVVSTATATDALFAWAATGTEHTAAQAVKADLVATLGTRTGLENTARALLALSVYGEDPASVGGRDLDADLRALMISDGGANDGRFKTTVAGTSPSTSVPLHARAMLALARTTGGVPATATAALSATQCANGSFPATWASATCGSLEVTALAAQALRAGGATADAAEAEAWLLAQQAADGTFAGTNGTDAGFVGLLAQTLRAAGHAAEADRSAAYVTGLQLGTADVTQAYDVGAIAQDAGRRATAVNAGGIGLGDRITRFRTPTWRAVLALGAPAYVAMAPPAVTEPPVEPTRWTPGACGPDQGVTVVVDFRTVADRLEVRCALGEQISGWAALANAGYPVGSVQGYPGAAICQVDDLPAEGFPTCWYNGYWSYYHAPNTDPGTAWTYSSLGYNNRKPPLNSVEGSRYVQLSSPNAPPAVGPGFPTPTVEIGAGPEATTTSGDASFTFTSSEVESTTTCSLDGAEAVPCTSPYDLTDVAPGEHTLTVTATTPALKEGSDTWTWRVLGAPECGLVPQAPTFDIVDADEDLTFTLADGYPVEHAVLTDLDADPATATFTAGAVVDLAPYEGETVRVVARRADGGCPDADRFDSVYDVREAYAPRWNLTDVAGAPSPSVATAEVPAGRWATGYANYVPGANVNANFQTPNGGLGSPASGLVVLGDRGRIDLTFAAPITDGPGYDLAVWENGFAVNPPANGIDFLELGYIEVSSNGTDFVRFDSASRQETPVGGFQGQRADLVGGVAGKDLSGRGTPFDLALLRNKPEVRDGTVDLERITAVRIVDITGDGDDLDSFGRPIYDAHPTTGSAGFDLTGAAALNLLDEVAPVVEITDAPPAVSTEREATIAYTVDDPGATVEYRVNGGDWVVTEASPIELTELWEADAYTVEVRATDGAGNVGSASVSWTIDQLAPDVRITVVPDTPTNSRTGTVEFTVDDPEATVECRATATADWVPCASPWSGTVPADGDHVMSVRATDAVGNEAVADAHWTVDTVAPVVLITAAPPASTTATTATFAYDLEDWTDITTVECRLDDGDWHGCQDPIEYTDLAVGDHTLTIRANDRARNVGTASHTWSVVAPRAANAAWVWAAYEDFLDREPTPEEVAATVARLDAGTPRSTVARELATSDEWLTAIVTRFYVDTLGRQPDASGLAYWVGELRSGRKSVAQVASSFYASGEYFAGIGGGSNTSWVTDLYGKLLERQPDAEGLAYWTGQVRARGRTWVALQMFQSLESRRARVTGLYQDLLGRAPDGAGRDYWAGRLTAEGDIALARSLAASGEYLTRAQVRFP